MFSIKSENGSFINYKGITHKLVDGKLEPLGFNCDLMTDDGLFYTKYNQVFEVKTNKMVYSFEHEIKRIANNGLELSLWVGSDFVVIRKNSGEIERVFQNVLDCQFNFAQYQWYDGINLYGSKTHRDDKIVCANSLIKQFTSEFILTWNNELYSYKVVRPYFTMIAERVTGFIDNPNGLILLGKNCNINIPRDWRGLKRNKTTTITFPGRPLTYINDNFIETFGGVWLGDKFHEGWKIVRNSKTNNIDRQILMIRLCLKHNEVKLHPPIRGIILRLYISQNRQI
jgi:hypothetical protein